LKTGDGKLLSWFELASDKNDFRPALAEIISKNQVRVYGHPEPTQVRLGWHETAIPNLVNSEGLPVVPFFMSH
jgi:sialate O-acetylesterase